MTVHSHPPDFGAPTADLRDVVVTHLLDARPGRPPDHAAENRALASLAQALAETPDAVLQRLADAALDLCRAGSAGISLEERDQGVEIFRWRATAGALAPFVGGVMPRDFSPCGVVVDSNAPQLMVDPVRRYPYVARLGVEMRQVLLIPFHRAEKPIGTIWVVAHDDHAFDAEDARLLTGLSRFASAAVQALQKTEEARRAAHAARLSEEHAFGVLESITDAFVAIDFDWRFTYANRQAEKLLGRAPGELLGKGLWEEYPGLLGTEFETAYRRAARERIASNVLAHYPDHDRWYEAHAYPAPDGLAIYFRDVSERLRADRAVRESEERYRTLFNSMDQGFCVVEVLFDAAGEPIDYRFLEANPMFAHQTGLSDAVGKTARELLPDLESRWIERYARVALTGEPARFVDGSEVMRRWFDVYAFRLGPAEERKVAILFSDITERTRAERVLAEADRVKERRLKHQRRLLDAVSALRVNVDLTIDSVLRVLAEVIREVIGAHQCVTSLTDGGWAESIDALSVSEKYADSFADHRTPPNGAGIHRLVVEENRVFRLTQSEVEAHPAWRAVGRERDARPPLRGWLAAPLPGVDGRAIGLIQLSDKYSGDFTAEDEATLVQFSQVAAGLLENVRLYKESRREIRSREEAEAALQQADRRKDEFLAMLAHELRNPLAPLRNGLQVMRLAADDPPTIAACRDMMDRQLSHMVRLIDDLLDVSRVTQNKMELRRARVLLADVVASAEETARPAMEAAGHSFTVTLPDRPVPLDADLTRLAQVFANLLTNSAKYTPNGGRVTLSATIDGDEVVVAVTDDGIGIPASALSSVFDLFSQVDRSVERASGGLGIGLALAKGLVEMHGGSVAATSDGPGLGSRFTVRLPWLSRESLPPAVEPATEAPASRPRWRVLVVDDNRDAADTMAATLRLLGHEVETAYDGREALAVGERFRPDAVLMDVGMPRLNGHEAARLARETDWGRSTAIVALTGWGQQTDREKSRESGCDGHLVKPVSLADVQAILRELLEDEPSTGVASDRPR